MTSTGRQASPSAKATGTRSTSSSEERAEQPQRRHARRQRGAGHSRGRLGARQRLTRSATISAGPTKPLAEEQDPGEPRERPRDEDVGHRHARRARSSGPSRTARTRCRTRRTPARRRARTGSRRCAAAALARGFELGPDVDLEMRAVADADHRAEHHHPDEEEARQLLGPDPVRDERGVARDDLQRDRDDQDADGRGHQPVEQPMVAVDELAHALPPCDAAKKVRRKDAPPDLRAMRYIALILL